MITARLKINFIYVYRPAISLLLILTIGSCKSINYNHKETIVFTDKNISEETLHVYQKLSNISKLGFAIGHQDATSYGIGWKHIENSALIKSDVKEVSGDFPAVFGFDIGHIELARENNLDSVPFGTMKSLITDAFQRGGIITISWHADNPVSGGDSWDKTPAVANLLAGGSEREKYELWIERVAHFLKSLMYNGKAIPVLFRPFHEMNGDWFWWGESNCTSSDYIQLWQQTVKLLRDVHQVHNLLYVYSPNTLNPHDEYLKYYPGDAYVDIFGIDIYDRNNSEVYIKSVLHDLEIVKNIATEKNKLYAFTETGLEKIPTPNWYHEVLYPAIENSGISWVLFWRNHIKAHHYMPYPGHASTQDFIEFEKLPKTLFLKDIEKLTK